MTKNADFYNDLIWTDNFFDVTFILFILFKFKFPTLVYNETDKCYYSVAPDTQRDGNPYFVRLTLNPLEGGTENDYEAIVDAGLYDDIYMKTGWKFSFNLGKVFYKNGLWTNS